MNKILSGLVTTGALLIVGALMYTTYQRPAPGTAQACTMEAKICPDGSAVGRSGQNCEFAACPNGDALFVSEGAIVFNDQAQTNSAGALVYQKDGQTYTKNLAFDSESMCTSSAGAGIMSCIAMNSTYEMAFGGGKKITISGIDRGADLLVRRLEVQSASTSTPPAQKASVTAKIGQTVSALGVSITPIEIVDDSRCATGVQCIWAGTVHVRVRIESASGESIPTIEIGHSVSTTSEFITLTTVAPAKDATAPTASAAYRVTFEVVKR